MNKDTLCLWHDKNAEAAVRDANPRGGQTLRAYQA